MGIEFEITDLSEIDENKIFCVRVALGNMSPQRGAKFMQGIKNELEPITEKVRKKGGHVLFIPIHDHNAIKIDLLEKEALDDIAEIISKHDKYTKAMEAIDNV